MGSEDEVKTPAEAVEETEESTGGDAAETEATDQPVGEQVEKPAEDEKADEE